METMGFLTVQEGGINVEQWKKLLLDQGYTEDEINQAYNTVSQQAGGLGLSMSQVDPRYFASQATGQPYINDETLAKIRQMHPARQQAPVAAPPMQFAEAIKRAKSMVGPLYDVESQKRIQSATRNMLSRGVYGQPFSGRIVSQQLAPLEAQRNAQIAQVAQSIVDSAQQRALQERQMGFNEWQAKQMLDLQRGQFAHTKEQTEFDRFVSALQLASGRRAEDFGREQFDYEKRYKDAQLELDRRRVDIADREPTAPPPSPKETYINSIYQKLLDGQQLTAEEKAIIGLSSGKSLRQLAIEIAQKDWQSWAAAETLEQREALIAQYEALLAGQMQASGDPQDELMKYLREEGYLKD